MLVTVSVAALIYGLSQGQQHGFAAPDTLVALAAAVLLARRSSTERRVAVPMVPVRVLAGPARRAALGAMFLVASVVVGYVYFVALYMQRVLHFSALRAGLGLLPATLTIMVMSTWVARRLAARFGRGPARGRAGVDRAGQLSLAQLSASGSYPVNVLPGILLTAFGMGLLFPTIAIVVTAGSSRRAGPGRRAVRRGPAGRLAVGLAVLATVAAARTRAATGPAAVALVSGYRLSFWVGVGIVACALALVLLASPRELAQARRRALRKITARSGLARAAAGSRER